MRRHWPRISGIFCFAMLVAIAMRPAASQDHYGLGAPSSGVRWQHDVEAAKALAAQSGRLVLVHVWTPSCAPCLALDQNVFNSSSVAAAIESQFVPVKLNANENPATAEKLGITRVPTDVILTAEGEVVGKLISPAAPAAYVAEVTQVATDYRAKATFPNPARPGASPVNSAYANLRLAPNTAPAIGQPGDATLTNPAAAPPVASPPTSSFVASSLDPSISTPTHISPPPPLPSAPPTDSLRAAVTPVTPISQATPPISPSFGAPPVSPPPLNSPAGEVTNPFMAAQPPVAPALTPSQPADVAPLAASPYGPPAVAAATVTFNPNVPANANVVPPQTSPPPQQAASSITPIPGAPDPKLLPPGAPPLGFEGFCPVSMRNNWKWVPGDPRWGVVHRGRTYWFATQGEQQQFWTDPDRYSPALSGMDPVMAIDHQQQVPGKREHSIDYDNLFYMFSSEATLQQFTANPERYATGVRQAMGIPRGRLVR